MHAGSEAEEHVTEISAAMVKQLRDATSAGMMECKRALQETEGDFDAAVKLLREKGMASAAKRADRETSEGKSADRVRGQRRRDRRDRLRDRARVQERGVPGVHREGAGGGVRRGAEAAGELEERRVELSGKAR